MLVYYDSLAAGCYAPGMNVLKELRFRFGSARRAHELHESIENNHAEIGRLRDELDSEKANARDERTIVERFHNLYYEQSRQTWQNTYWMGTRVMKAPSDLWVYQEIIHEIKPDLVLETGTALGGSALYLANLFDIVGKGRVVTVDLEEREGNPVPSHGASVTCTARPWSRVSWSKCERRRPAFKPCWSFWTRITQRTT